MTASASRPLRIAFAATLSLASSTAYAQSRDERPPVYWEAGPCAEVDLARVRRVLDVELHGLLVNDSHDGAAIHVTLRCDREGVTLSALGAGAPLVRSHAWSALPPTPSGRARVVALVSVELAFLAWLAPPSVESPQPAQPRSDHSNEPSVSVDQRAPSRPDDGARDESSWAIAAAGELVAMQRSALLFGGGVTLRHVSSSGLAIGLRGEALTGSLGGESLARWSGALSLGLETAWQSWRFHLDASMLAGVARTTLGGAWQPPVAWLSPSLRVGGTVRLSRHFGWEFSGLLGFATALGESASSVDALTGVWCGLQTGATLRW